MVSQETLLDVLLETSNNLRETMGLSEEQATVIAKILIETVQDKFGGTEIYIHAQAKKELQQKVLDAWHSGVCVPDLVDKFNLSKSTVYRILNS
jgi:Mor family transcriptional regulator